MLFAGLFALWVAGQAASSVPPTSASSVQAATPAPSTPAATVPAGDPVALVRQAVELLEKAGSDTNRFTYFLDLKLANLGPYGVGPVQWMRYEVTYINNLKYDHLVARDGSPLTGKDLADETKRYEAAIHKKTDLAEAKRGKSDGYRMEQDNFLSPADVLGPDYVLTMVASHKTEVGTVDEIDAKLAPKVKHKGTCPWHVRLFIGEADHVLYRFVEDPASDTSWRCVGESYDMSFQVVDGLPEPKLESLRFNMEEHGNRFTVLNSFRYTGYKRFKSTVTLEPDVTVEPDTATPPPDPKPAP